MSSLLNYLINHHADTFEGLSDITICKTEHLDFFHFEVLRSYLIISLCVSNIMSVPINLNTKAHFVTVKIENIVSYYFLGPEWWIIFP